MTVYELIIALQKFDKEKEVVAWGHGVMEIKWVSEPDDEDSFGGEAEDCVVIGVDC